AASNFLRCWYWEAAAGVLPSSTRSPVQTTTAGAGSIALRNEIHSVSAVAVSTTRYAFLPGSLMCRSEICTTITDGAVMTVLVLRRYGPQSGLRAVRRA